MECSYCNVEFDDLPVHHNGEVYCSGECAKADSSEGVLELHEVEAEELFGEMDLAPKDDFEDQF